MVFKIKVASFPLYEAPVTITGTAPFQVFTNMYREKYLVLVLAQVRWSWPQHSACHTGRFLSFVGQQLWLRRFSRLWGISFYLSRSVTVINHYFWSEHSRSDFFFPAECCFLFSTLILLLLLCLFLLVSIESCLGWRGGIPPTADAGGGRMNYILNKKRLSVVSSSIPANLFWPVMILIVLWRLKYTVDFAIKLNDQCCLSFDDDDVSLSVFLHCRPLHLFITSFFLRPHAASQSHSFSVCHTDRECVWH